MGSSSSPQFFSAFDPQHSSQSLMIPHAFANKINGKIPNRVILRNGLGKIWLVDVANSEDDGLYLEGGWSKFVSNNSLEPGDFLVFKYSGQRIFDVLILAKNGCEKELVAAMEDDEQEVGDQEDMANSQFRKVSPRMNSDSKGGY